LVTLNEPLFLDCARALALRTLSAGRPADAALDFATDEALGSGEWTDAERLVYAFRCCVARPPTGPELDELLSLLRKETQRFESGGLDPWDLISPNPSERPHLPEGVTPPRLAAWTVVSRVLLNLDETITKE